MVSILLNRINKVGTLINNSIIFKGFIVAYNQYTCFYSLQGVVISFYLLSTYLFISYFSFLLGKLLSLLYLQQFLVILVLYIFPVPSCQFLKCYYTYLLPQSYNYLSLSLLVVQTTLSYLKRLIILYLIISRILAKFIVFISLIIQKQVIQSIVTRIQ